VDAPVVFLLQAQCGILNVPGMGRVLFKYAQYPFGSVRDDLAIALENIWMWDGALIKLSPRQLPNSFRNGNLVRKDVGDLRKFLLWRKTI